MSDTYIQTVPFVDGYRIVSSGFDEDDAYGVAAVEALVGIDERGEPTWCVEQIFTCSTHTEVLGIACAFAATILNDMSMSEVVNGLSRQTVVTPGGKYLIRIKNDSGYFKASIAERLSDGSTSEVNSIFHLPNFYEAYGWALANVGALYSREAEE